MALSFFERKLVEGIKKDIKHNKIDIKKIMLLSFDGVKELINITEFQANSMYLNQNVVYQLLGAIRSGEIYNYFDNDYKVLEYFSLNMLKNKPFTFYKKCLAEYPQEIASYLSKERYKYKNKIDSLSEDEIKKILDSLTLTFYNNNSFGIENVNKMGDFLVSLIKKLKDEDKIKYLNTLNFDGPYYYNEILKSITSRDSLLKGIYIYLRHDSWAQFENIEKYVTNEELFEIAKEYIKHSHNLFSHSFFKYFSLDQKLLLVDLILQNENLDYDLSHHSFESLFNDIIKEALENNHDYFIYEKLYQLFLKNKKEYSLNINIEKSLLSPFLDSLNPNEFLEFYKKNNYKKLKDFIKEKKEYWLREPVFSYLVDTEPIFIFNSIENYIKYGMLTPEEKDMFFSKNVVEKLASTKGILLDGIIIRNSIEDYFKENGFCYKVLTQNQDAISLCLSVNPNPELLSFVFSKGWIPNEKTYKECQKSADLKAEYIKQIKNFDVKRADFAQVFTNLSSIADDEELIKILLEKVAINLSMPYESVFTKFKALKQVNREILSTFDYNLFSDKFSFLGMNKLERIGAHENISNKLCQLTPPELAVIRRILNFSSTINWIDLLDRLLSNINGYYGYNELINDIFDKELDSEELTLLTQIMIQPNHLNITKYEDLKNYNILIDNKIQSLIKQDYLEGYKAANSLSILGIDYKEFYRIYQIYCSDLNNFCKVSKNEEIKQILTLINNVCSCNSYHTLKDIYLKTPKIKVSPNFLINLDTEIRKEFARLYNETFYKIKEQDKMQSIYYKEVIDENGKSKFEKSLENNGIPVTFYTPLGLGENGQDFSIMITSLGAYSNHEEPDDYYSNWNVDLINSHGFCCSYLTNDNLGTARICHACLGFTDFDPEALLLSAPYDIGSSEANRKFNTSREKDTQFCTPRGMVDNTRHTHNEVVWERRNLSLQEEFKKKPSYVVFFCKDFNNLDNEEALIYNSTIKAAIQLGKKEQPLPVIVIERTKIAAQQKNNLNNLLGELMTNYKPGIAKEIITKFISNRVANTYCEEVQKNYFNDNYQMWLIQSIHLKIIDLINNGNLEEGKALYQEVHEAILHEEEIANNDNSKVFITEEKNFSTKMQFLMQLKKDDSYLFKNMLTVISEIGDNNLERWNSISSDFDKNSSEFMEVKNYLPELFTSINKSKISLKLQELEADSIYKPNTPYDNRHIANMYLYALMIYENSSFFQCNLDMLFDVIKYKQCSYMDGDSNKNYLSSASKAENIMKAKNYSQEKIDNIKLLIFLQDEKEITKEKVNKIIHDHNLSSVTLNDCQEIYNAISLIHDAGCLEHTRFITAGELSKSYFLNPDNFRFAKMSYQLQESYASMDIRNYIKENPSLSSEITQLLKEKNPQEVIRNIRKSRIKKEEHEFNSFENAFLEIEVEEKTNPLNLLESKLKNYGTLPQQISITDFYSQVLNLPQYSYLIQKIASKEKLYLNESKIHGENHSNNVTLFATYIATLSNIQERDIKTIIEAAIYHDIGRVNDNFDYNHGTLGAVKYGAKISCPNDISVNEVKFLIEAHALAKVEDINLLFNRYQIPEKEQKRLYQMATILRDADALDRTRFQLLNPTNNLKPEYLTHDISKKMIESCQRLNYIIYQDYVKSNQNQEEIRMTT